MKSSLRSLLNARGPLPTFLSLLLLLACSPPVEGPKGPAREYADAKDLFFKGNFDRALEFTDSLAASPPNAFTERAEVLRSVIFSGELEAFKELAEAYEKGFAATKNPHYKSEFERLRHDNLQYGCKRALDLGEVAQKLTKGRTISKQLTLEATYPSAEGPMVVAQLNRVMEGGWVESDDRETAALEAQRKGIDDALAKVVGGDRAKARNAMGAGTVKLDGTDFAIFLGQEVLTGARLFDRWHSTDPAKLKVLCAIADTAANAGLALLKDNPNKDKEQELKKLQEGIKAALKTT